MQVSAKPEAACEKEAQAKRMAVSRARMLKAFMFADSSVGVVCKWCLRGLKGRCCVEIGAVLKRARQIALFKAEG